MVDHLGYNAGTLDSRELQTVPVLQETVAPPPMSQEDMLRQEYANYANAVRNQPTGPSAASSWGAPAMFGAMALGLLGPVGAAAGFALGNTAMTYALRKDAQRAAPLNQARQLWNLNQEYNTMQNELSQIEQQKQDRENSMRLAELQYGSKLDRDARAIMKGMQEQGTPISYMEALEMAKQYGSRASNRPFTSFTDRDGNLVLVDADGTVRNTGQQKAGTQRKVVYQDGNPFVEISDVWGNKQTRDIQDPEFSDLLEAEVAAYNTKMERQVEEKVSMMEAEDIANANDAVETVARTGMSDQMTALSFMERLLLDLTNPSGRYYDVYTGKAGAGLVAEFNDKIAELEAMGVEQLLQNLNITKLTPVSNFEVQLVRQMFLDIAAYPERNVGRLRSTIGMFRRKLAVNQDLVRWKDAMGDMKGYRPPAGGARYDPNFGRQTAIPGEDRIPDPGPGALPSDVLKNTPGVYAVPDVIDLTE